MLETKDKYSKRAKYYDWIEERMPMSRFKKQCITLLSGKILEVGIGSGGSVKFYSKEQDVIGIDFSSGMLALCEEKIIKNQMDNIKLVEMNIENMNFLDNSFDSVFSACVFCTVPNPEKGLSEIYRVLKPGGKAVFLEHMKSSSKIKNFFMRIIEKIINPLMGTFLLRETENSIRKLNFSKVESNHVMMGDVLRIIIATK